MKLAKRLRAVFGVHASRVTVRPQVSWQSKSLILVLGGILGAALLWWLFGAGQKFAGFDRAAFEERLNESTNVVQQLTRESSELKSRLAALQQQAQIDRAAQIELSKGITQLQEENAHLREEVTFFRRIMPSGGPPNGLSVQNFQVEPDALPNEYRFHALLVQGGQRDRDFIGRAQLLITHQQEGAPATLIVSDDDKIIPPIDVNFKYYQRLEGRFKVKPGVVIKLVNLRIIEKSTGQVRLMRSLRLS